MERSVRYRPIVRNTSPEHRAALKSAFIRGEELCPPCAEAGRRSSLQERYGETT